MWSAWARSPASCREAVGAISDVPSSGAPNCNRLPRGNVPVDPASVRRRGTAHSGSRLANGRHAWRRKMRKFALAVALTAIPALAMAQGPAVISAFMDAHHMMMHDMDAVQATGDADKDFVAL